MYKTYRDQNILVINVPFSFVDYRLCPINQVSIETLKFISFLKQNNTVEFIDMREGEIYSYGIRSLGIKNFFDRKILIQSLSKSKFIQKINELLFSKISKIIIVAQTLSAPYIFEVNFINRLIVILKSFFNDISIEITGNFVKLFPGALKQITAKYSAIMFQNFDDLIPDFSVKKEWKYGLFQLTKGCVNSCSFCNAGLEKFTEIDVDFVLNYMMKFEEKYGPVEFWNWDQNVIFSKSHFLNFLKKYNASGLKSKLNFSLGLQPDKLDFEIMDELLKTNFRLITIPFETATLNLNFYVKKPYTIISPIQKLKYLNENMRFTDNTRIQCSFIIGYPFDDYRSIFRTFISILNLGGFPLPFPLFIFPNTQIYNDNFSEVANRIISDLHGKLWPLVDPDDVLVYDNLLYFLRSNSFKSAQANLSKLPIYLRKIYKEELLKNNEFIELCISAKDTVCDLKKIEEKLELNSKNNKILCIYSSPKKENNSNSTTLAKYFMKAIYEVSSENVFDELFLASENLEFLDEDFIDAITGKKKISECSDKAQFLFKKADEYINLIKNADKIIIASPMWTLSIPSILKAFLELIASKLFYYYSETLDKKKICCILTRDGNYSKFGTGSVFDEQINVQEKLLMASLDFIGLGREIHFIYAENMYGSDKEQNLLKAKEELYRYSKIF